MKEHVTIFEKDGEYTMLKILLPTEDFEGKMSYVGNFKRLSHPNILLYEFDSNSKAASEYKKAVENSAHRYWKILWQGKPNYG